MKNLMRKAGRAVLRAAKRFLTNSPANMYERVIFSAVRDIAFNFGKGALA